MASNPFFTAVLTLVVILFWIWGVLGLRDKKRQVLASVSLLTLLITWGASLLFSAYFVVGRPPLPAWITILCGLTIIVGSLSSLILGIVSLCLWSSRAEHIKKGKGSASVSIFVNLALLVTVVVVRFSSNETPSVATNDSIFPSGPIHMPEQNFSVNPDSPWLNMADPKKFHAQSCLAMRIANPETWMILIVEESSDLDMAVYKDIVQSNFLNAGLKVDPASEKEREVNGMNFQTFKVSGEVKEKSATHWINYESWLAHIEGRAYQFLFWTPKDAENLSLNVEKFMGSFRTLGKPPSSKLKDADSKDWGIKTALQPLGWQEWTDEKARSAHAQFSAIHSFRALHIIPLHWDKKRPDPEAATAAILSLMDFEYPSAVYGRKPWSDPETGISGFEYSAEISSDPKPFHYRLRIAHHEDFSWLIAAWSVGDDAENIRSLEDALSAVKLSPPRESSAFNPPRTSALTLNRVGLYHYNAGRYNEAETFFREAAGKDPSDEVIVSNIADALWKMGRHADAIELIQNSSPGLRSKLNMKEAALLVDSERPLEANVIYRKALDSQSLSENDAQNWIRSLLAVDENKLGLEAALSYSQLRPNTRSRGWLAEAMAANEDYDSALELVKTLVAENPHQSNLRLDLAEMSNRANRPAEAEMIANALITEGQDSLRARLALGYSFMNRRWYRQAKESFEAALKISPQNEEVKEALSDSSTRLGQGSNSGIKEPIEPVSNPSLLQARLDAVPSVEPTENDHAQYLRYINGWHFQPRKSLRQTMTRSIKILDASAVTDFSSLAFDFDPTFERIHVNRLEVFDSDDKRIATGNIDDYYVLDARGDTADDDKTLHVPIPALAAGNRIEIQVTKEYLQAPEHFPFERFMFGGKMPIVAEALFISGDTSSIKARLSISNDIETFGDDATQIWLAKPRAGSVSEAGIPDPETSYPVLRIGPPSGTWAEAGKAYLEQIHGQLKPDKNIEILAKEIAPADSPVTIRAAAIARYVQKSLNYHAIEFGPRGRIPRTAAETIQRKQGDCKDHSVLLHQLLTAAGIPSQLVLVDTDWNVDEEIPTLDQFNHMIVRIPDLKPFPYVDPTAKDEKAGELPPWGLWEKNALILDREKSKLVKLPIKPADCASLKITRSASVMDEGGLSIEEQTFFTGYYAQWIRSYFRGETKARQLDLIQSIFAGRGAYQVESVDFPDPNDPTLEAMLNIRYRMAPDSSGEIVLPTAWESDYLSISFINQRKNPFEWQLPTRIHSETLLKAKIPLSDDYLKALQASDENEFCRWKSEVEAIENQQVKITYRFETTAKTYPADHYARLRDAWSGSLIPARHKIRFQKP